MCTNQGRLSREARSSPFYYQDWICCDRGLFSSFMAHISYEKRCSERAGG